MANIKVLDLESPSSLFELSHENTDSITGGALGAYQFVLRTSGNERNARYNALITLRKTRSLTRSLSSPG